MNGVVNGVSNGPTGLHSQPDECGQPDVQHKSIDARWIFGSAHKLSGPIMEVGGNMGDDFQHFIWNYPDAQIYTHEPIDSNVNYLKPIAENASGRAHVMNVGVGDHHEEDVRIYQGNDPGDNMAATMFDTQSGSFWSFEMVDALDAFRNIENETGQVVMGFSMNCEGCEYDVMRRFADSSYLGRIQYVQVSWHVVQVKDRINTRCYVASKLESAGYRKIYTADYGWEGWSMGPICR